MTDPNRDILIMGILNLTDDSFFAPSRHRLSILEEGADIIDIGAVSTRPGAADVDVKEEWRRLRPVLESLDPQTVISIDTTSAVIVEKAAELLGRRYTVNDISAGEDDPQMLSTVGRLQLPYIAMHKRGNPRTMQGLCKYDDLVEDLLSYFREFDSRAAEAGIHEWILDPGFGFAKSAQQCYTLLRELPRLCGLGRPLLVGISRKSFIYKPLDITPDKALTATSALHLQALIGGADILRVHDVAPAREIVALYRNYFRT